MSEKGELTSQFPEAQSDALKCLLLSNYSQKQQILTIKMLELEKDQLIIRRVILSSFICISQWAISSGLASHQTTFGIFVALSYICKKTKILINLWQYLVHIQQSIVVHSIS